MLLLRRNVVPSPYDRHARGKQIPPFLASNVVGSEAEAASQLHAQFFLGPAGTGAPMHVHKNAWNAVAHGAKQW